MGGFGTIGLYGILAIAVAIVGTYVLLRSRK